MRAERYETRCPICATPMAVSFGMEDDGTEDGVAYVRITVLGVTGNCEHAAKTKVVAPKRVRWQEATWAHLMGEDI